MCLPMRVFLAQHCAIGDKAIGNGLQGIDDMRAIHRCCTRYHHRQNHKKRKRRQKTRKDSMRNSKFMYSSIRPTEATGDKLRV